MDPLKLHYYAGVVFYYSLLKAPALFDFNCPALINNSKFPPNSIIFNFTLYLHLILHNFHLIVHFKLFRMNTIW